MNLGVAISIFKQLVKDRRPVLGFNQFLGWTTVTYGRDDYWSRPRLTPINPDFGPVHSNMQKMHRYFEYSGQSRGLALQ